MGSARHVVGLVQVNNGFSGQHYLPYSVGVLESYAKAHLTRPENYEFLIPIFCRLSTQNAAEKILGADVVGFSLYVWNEQISLRIAHELKTRNPHALIVCGGPQVPDRVESFLRAHPFVDVAVHGEGEIPFVAILEQLPERDFSRVPGVSYLKDGVLVTNARPPRIDNLESIPSPYLTGMFDPLMAENPDHQWIAMWETNRGCPFSCTYCDWGSAVAQRVFGWSIERLHGEVDWFAAHQIEYVFTADANFGIMERDEDLASYCASVKEATSFPHRISVQSTKSGSLNSKLTERSFRVQKILSDSGLNQGVVVSMQSLYPPTLKAIKRANISTEAFKEIQNRFNASGVETMTDLILGLPEETFESFADGVSELIAGGQHNRIQFNNLSILPNAEMGDPEYQKRYGMETVQSRIINIHGFREESDEDVDECQDLVIATASMPREEWVRTRVFAWMSAFLHFDKILQIPLMAMHELAGVPYRTLIEAFMDAETVKGYPTLKRIHDFFEAKAIDIQAGGEEYCHSAQYLNIWWPADELAFIELVARRELPQFYKEASELFFSSFVGDGTSELQSILNDATTLNQALIKIPFVENESTIKTFWDMFEFRNRVMRGEKARPQAGKFFFVIDRTSERWNSLEDWCRHVVWYGNKRGAYLYGNASVKQIAGHF